MQRDRSKTDARRRLLGDDQPVAGRPLGLPVLGCFLAATLSFGAARIHASGSIAAGDKGTEPPAITTQIVDFVPQAYAPAAFADWSEPKASAAE